MSEKTKKSLIYTILDNLPIRTQLPFGVNSNVRLTKVSDVVKKRDGQAIERNSHVTFTKFNKEGKGIAQTEFSYWNLKHDGKFSLRNLITQVSNLSAIADAVLGEAGLYDPFADAGFEDYEELQEKLGTKKGAKKIQELVESTFCELMTKTVIKNSPVLNLKVVTTWDGQYTQLPEEGAFIEEAEEDEESGLTVSAKELQIKGKGDVPKTAKSDNKSGVPAGKKDLMSLDI